MSGPSRDEGLSDGERREVARNEERSRWDIIVGTKGDGCGTSGEGLVSGCRGGTRTQQVGKREGERFSISLHQLSTLEIEAES